MLNAKERAASELLGRLAQHCGRAAELSCEDIDRLVWIMGRLARWTHEDVSLYLRMAHDLARRVDERGYMWEESATQ